MTNTIVHRVAVNANSIDIDKNIEPLLHGPTTWCHLNCTGRGYNVKLFLGLGLKPYTHFLEDRAFSPQWRV